MWSAVGNPQDRSKSAKPFLLAQLHELQERDGYLTRAALENLAESAKIPVAELYGFVNFFHYFRLEGPRDAVCRGPVCSLKTASANRPLPSASIPCPGLCDRPVGEFRDGKFGSFSHPDAAYTLPYSAPGSEVLSAYAKLPVSQKLATYRSAGGYRQLEKLVSEKKAEEFLNELEAGELCGRGGAAFPFAAKLKAVRAQKNTPKYLVCNADEGETATFKDRSILHLTPHLLLEGMAICGHLAGLSRGIIYLRYEYPEAFRELGRAIDEARREGFLGQAFGSFDIEIVRGAGSYVCGEESALLSSLEGRMPWPRERPPFPTEKGLWEKPTVVSNVETLANIPPLLAKGADWFRSLGRNGNAGTKIYSVSGAVKRAGNFELPLGTTARELIAEHAGGALKGRIQAFTLGGISGGILGEQLLDLPLDYRAPQSEGFFLGSGGIVVLDESCCVVDFVRSCLLFYESESCGKCYPCRIGTVRLREFFDGLTGRDGGGLPDPAEIDDILDTMANTSACGLGTSVPLLLYGLNRFFPEEIEQHRQRKVCRAALCRF